MGYVKIRIEMEKVKVVTIMGADVGTPTLTLELSERPRLCFKLRVSFPRKLSKRVSLSWR